MLDLDIFNNSIESMFESFSNKGLFNFEITTTDKCNCSCTYCFESKEKRQDIQYDKALVVHNIHYLLQHEKFKEHFNGILLTFWGGEPFLKTDDILYYIKEFGHNQLVRWHFYTNGTLKENMLSVIEAFKKCNALNRVIIQISWDGDPVHDINRISKNADISSNNIKNIYKELYQSGINVELKATIKPSEIKYFPQVWKSYESFIEEVSNGNDHHMMWAPTIDQTYDSTEYLSVFKKVLPQICSYEIDYYKKYKKNLLSWFGSDYYTCSYREGMCCVGIDGNIYTCHGIAYENSIKEKECLGSIYNTEWIDKYLFEIGTHELQISDDCKKCFATHCSKCCVQSLVKSHKESQIDKWFDRTTSSSLCKFYQIFGIYDKALHTILTQMTINGEL